MGEAKRKHSFRFLLDAPEAQPVPLDVIQYTGPALRQLLAAQSPPEPETIRHIHLIMELLARVRNPTLPTVLCCTCDYDFPRNDFPASVVLAVPRGEHKNMTVMTMALCPSCTGQEWGYLSEKIRRSMNNGIVNNATGQETFVRPN